ncbi:putative naringenin-chalcone synthase [Bacteriovorax sp. BSW11_IV]|uniref:type III polyketide synthase n=1 Tax=Bacteriovorax sp. BSW11_IV TaxID=1353529 RepID=UPI00038A2344|nr:naringenin-chalcone synthase [Bacteriovorax sp. BSW11_IV]EQC48573.1 putative naringenin-chalcone synthase [Bacteriovorax sp. BSW11_IV]
MPFLVDIQTCFPENYYTQEKLIEKLTTAWSGKVTNLSRVESIHSNVLVKGRHLALPLEKYFELKSFDEKNNLFIENALKLATGAITKILKTHNLEASDISSLWSNTVTGFAIPSLEARVMNLLPFAKNTKRVPLLGLGCMAGVAGINRVSDYLKAYPKEAVIFFSVELCSLTIQMDDVSPANLVSTGLFGDGAAAVLMVGDEHPLAKKAHLQWLSSESVFFPDTERVMGWGVGEKGLKIILSKGVPEVTEGELPAPLHSFLSKQGLELKDISSYFAHPGGPKVLLAMEKVLDLPQGGLKHSWESLAENGNMSSVSVLDIFKRNLDHRTPDLKGHYGLSLAMGPAFSAEMGLFKWN